MSSKKIVILVVARLIVHSLKLSISIRGKLNHMKKSTWEQIEQFADFCQTVLRQCKRYTEVTWLFVYNKRLKVLDYYLTERVVFFILHFQIFHLLQFSNQTLNVTLQNDNRMSLLYFFSLKFLNFLDALSYFSCVRSNFQRRLWRNSCLTVKATVKKTSESNACK